MEALYIPSYCMYTYFSGIHIIAESSALIHDYANMFENN